MKCIESSSKGKATICVHPSFGPPTYWMNLMVIGLEFEEGRVGNAMVVGWHLTEEVPHERSLFEGAVVVWRHIVRVEPSAKAQNLVVLHWLLGKDGQPDTQDTTGVKTKVEEACSLWCGNVVGGAVIEVSKGVFVDVHGVAWWVKARGELN